MRKFQPSLRSVAVWAIASGAVCSGLSAPAGAQITHKSIPLDVGGWFSGFATHPTSGRIYGYGDVFGAWRSDDGGNTWSYLNRNFTVDDNFITGMAVDPADVNRVAFRTSTRVWRSNDGGATWSAILTDGNSADNGLNRGTQPLMFYPGRPNELWMVGIRKNTNGTLMTGSLWRLTNGSTTWEKMGGTAFDTVKVLSVYVHPNRANEVWVGAKDGFYVSTNSGVSFTRVWTNATAALAEISKVRRLSNGIGYISSKYGYQVTASNWNDTSTYVITQRVNSVNGYGPDGTAVLINPVDGGEDIWSSRENQKHISYDDGNSFQSLTTSFYWPNPKPIWGSNNPNYLSTGPLQGHEIVQDPTNLNRLFMPNGKAPMVSNDYGRNWTYVPSGGGIAGVMTYRVNFPKNNANMALIPGSDVGAIVVTDGGSSGNAQRASVPFIQKHQTAHEIMSSSTGTTLVAAGSTQGNPALPMIVKSIDSGATWTELNVTSSGLPAKEIVRSVMNPDNPNDYVVMITSTSSSNIPPVYRTTNGGTNFAAVSGLPNNLDTGSTFHPENSFLLGDGVNASTRYLIARGTFAYRSTDHGQNWSAMTHPWAGSGWVWDMSVDRATAGKLWVVGDYLGIKTSNDGGTNWVSVGNVVGADGKKFTTAKYIDAANGQVAVWGRRTGDEWHKLYFSHDNGVTWTEATGPNYRYAFTKAVAVDPYVKGKVWVSGISINVITGLPGSTPAPNPGTNVPLTNPGFESGLSGWLGGGSVFGVNSAAPRSGSYNSYNNGSWNSIFQNVTVQPNSSYTLKAWGRLATATAGNNQAIYVNNGGTILSSWISGTSYAQYTINFTTGANTTSIQVGNYDAGSSVVAYTDDYTLTKN